MQNKTFRIYFDEAWRWPLAGPLFIGLVCPLKKLSKKELEVFCDSKKISEIKREELFLEIEKLQKKWKIIFTPSRVTAAEIDKYWVSNSLHCSILRWMLKIFNDLLQRLGCKAASLPTRHNTESHLDMIVLIIIGSDRANDNIIYVHYPRIGVLVVITVDKSLHGLLWHLESRIWIPSGIPIHRRICPKVTIQVICILRAESAQDQSFRP